MGPAPPEQPRRVTLALRPKAGPAAGAGRLRRRVRGGATRRGAIRYALLLARSPEAGREGEGDDMKRGGIVGRCYACREPVEARWAARVWDSTVRVRRLAHRGACERELRARIGACA